MEQGFATQLPLKTQQGKTPSQRQNHPWGYPNLAVQASAPFASLANLCGEGAYSPNFRSTILKKKKQQQQKKIKIFLPGEVQRNTCTFGAIVSNSYTTPHVRRCKGEAEGGL